MSLGYDLASGDLFDQELLRAVQAFQGDRGLPLRDVIDEVTWRVLEETSWQLGDRLLYVSRPFLRGDDVVVLQQSLSLLGFDPGRVDGIFGPLTEQALREFQANVGLEASGTLTMSSLRELERLAPRDSSRRMVSEVRQRVDLIREATTRLVGIGGSSPLLSSLVDALGSAELSVVALSGSDDEQADQANGHKVGLALFITERPELDRVRVYFYESFRFHSLHGSQMASAVGVAIEADVAGMALPVLRQTTMTALAISHPTLSSIDQKALIDAVLGSLSILFNS